MKKKNGFTFVELMVVMAITGIIFAVTAVTYSNVTKNSRDSRRKADMESIRQALELCRSYSGTYISASGGYIPETISCGTPPVVYMQSVPTDPKTQATRYEYSTDGITYSLSTSSMENQSNPYIITNP